MNSFYLIRKNLTRNKLRMFLNLFAIMIAFLLFGALGSIKNAFESGAETAAADRLVVVNKISFTQTMPVSYVNKIRAMSDVKTLTWANWFGGYYQDVKQQAMTFVVDAESYFDVYPELILEDTAKQSWFNNRQGVVVGETIANTFGWKKGDRIPLSSNIYANQDGSRSWDVVIEGIFKGDTKKVDTSYILMHHKYLFETLANNREWVGWMILSTGNPEINDAVARKIDAQFANSTAETETSTEAAFNKAFAEQIGDIGFIITSVVLAAFFTILMIVGNSMTLAVRERTREIGVLKTLGFPSTRIFLMVLSESLLLALIGGLLGLSLAEFIVIGMSETPAIARILPTLNIDLGTRINALILILVLGLTTGFLPAYRALKLKTIDALARG